MLTDTIWITGLTGGLAGALLTLIGQQVWLWWSRPILEIKNRGKTFAKNASVCVTQITCRAAGSGEKTFAEEVFDLNLAQTAGDTLVFNLGSGGGHRFIDFVHTSLDDNNYLELIFDFGKGAHRLAPLNFGSGRYEVKVFACAENAKSITRDLHWSYGKTLESLKIETRA